MYATSDVLESNSAVHCPRLEMASRSKLSCVVWNSYIKSLLLAADYDGCLALWDAETNTCTATFEEHAKRVWSADFSQVRDTPFPFLGFRAGSIRVFWGTLPVGLPFLRFLAFLGGPIRGIWVKVL